MRSGVSLCSVTCCSANVRTVFNTCIHSCRNIEMLIQFFVTTQQLSIISIFREHLKNQQFVFH